MQHAVEILNAQGHSASYEYDGWISFREFAFGDSNGDYSFNREDCEELVSATEKIQWFLPRKSTAEELAAWIVEVRNIFP